MLTWCHTFFAPNRSQYGASYCSPTSWLFRNRIKRRAPRLPSSGGMVPGRGICGHANGLNVTEQSLSALPQATYARHENKAYTDTQRKTPSLVWPTCGFGNAGRLRLCRITRNMYCLDQTCEYTPDVTPFRRRCSLRDLNPIAKPKTTRQLTLNPKPNPSCTNNTNATELLQFGTTRRYF